MDLKDILKAVFLFDTMLTPKIITFVYWLMLIADIVVGIVVMNMPRYYAFGGVGPGLGILIGGIIFDRIFCEILVVIFKINDHLRRIAEAQAPHEAAGRSTTNAGIRGPSAPEGIAQ